MTCVFVCLCSRSCSDAVIDVFVWPPVCIRLPGDWDSLTLACLFHHRLLFMILTRLVTKRHPPPTTQWLSDYADPAQQSSSAARSAEGGKSLQWKRHSRALSRRLPPSFWKSNFNDLTVHGFPASWQKSSCRSWRESAGLFSLQFPVSYYTGIYKWPQTFWARAPLMSGRLKWMVGWVLLRRSSLSPRRCVNHLYWIIQQRKYDSKRGEVRFLSTATEFREWTKLLIKSKIPAQGHKFKRKNRTTEWGKG